jgi:hypothetical protein
MGALTPEAAGNLLAVVDSESIGAADPKKKHKKKR